MPYNNQDSQSFIGISGSGKIENIKQQKPFTIFISKTNPAFRSTLFMENIQNNSIFRVKFIRIIVDVLFYLAILIAAIMYSSVGHGGASGYLAIMALFAFHPELMKTSALTLNLFVAGIAFFSFYKANHFKFKLLWPFILTSIPFSFIGGLVSIDARLYKILLGVCLLIAVARILLKPRKEIAEIRSLNIPIAVAIGVLLGFFSGLIGIGGGIILSPLILLLRWGSIKETAAVSAAFIFLNSASGLAGKAFTGITYSPEIFIMVAVAITGGLIGSNIGSFRLSSIKLSYSLAIVLLIASVKLFLI